MYAQRAPVITASWGGEKAWNAQRGTARDKTQGQLMYQFTSNSGPHWVVNFPHAMCLMCNIFSVIMVMLSVYMLNDYSS